MELSFIFWQMELSGRKIKLQKGTFRGRKTKKAYSEKFLIFQEMELFNPKIKKFLYFRREPAKLEKKSLYFYKKWCIILG